MRTKRSEFTDVLTSEQLANLRSSPIEVFPAQGLNTVIIPDCVFLMHGYYSVPFNIGAAKLSLNVGDKMLFQPFSPVFLTSEEDSFVYKTNPGIDDVGVLISNCVNKSVYITNIGDDDIINGNGILAYTIYYNIFETGI